MTTVQRNGGVSSAAGYTRPAQGPAIGTDPEDGGDGDNAAAIDVNAPVGPMVVSTTGPTFTRTPSFKRRFRLGV